MISRIYYVWVFALALVGIIGAYLIQPRPQELALMHMQDKYFEEALKQYTQLRAKGDTTLQTVVPLSKLYLQYGKIEEAITIMEQFVEDHPKSVEALEQLGVLYQYAQRPGDYLKNLEEVYALKPSAKVLREMANIYNFYGAYDKQVNALETLIHKYPPVEQDYMNLAYMYASQGQVDKAESTLDKMFEVFKSDLQVGTVEFAVSLYLDIGKEDKATKIASDYVVKHHNVENAIRFAARMHNKGKPEQAMQLLEPFEREGRKDPAFLRRYIELQVDNGQKEIAYERLKTMVDNKALPQDVLDQYLFLLADRKADREIGDILKEKKYDLSLLSESTWLDVIRVISINKQREDAKVLQSRLDPAYLSRYATIDASLKLVAGDPKGAVAMMDLLKGETVTDYERIKLIKIAFSENRKDLVDAGLDSFSRKGVDVEKSKLFDIAELYFDVNRPAEGYKLFSVLKHGKPGTHQGEIEHIWALMATATGNEQEVVDWVKTVKRQMLVLVDIFEKALQYQRKDIAMVVATDLYERAPNNQYRRFYADALLLNNKNEEALSHYQELVKYEQNEYIIDGYTTALERIIKTVPEPRRTQLKSELHHYLVAKLSYPGITLQGKRTVAYGLLEHGWYDEAEALFFEMAKNAPPQSPDVGQLLYMWKGKPNAQRLAWLKERTQTADAKEKAEWYKRLVEAGQRDYIVEAVNQSGYWSQPRDIRDLYLSVLMDQKRYSIVRPLLAKEVEAEHDIKRLGGLAQIALGAEMPDLSEKAYNKILAMAPTQVEALRQIALLHYYRGSYTQAKQYFKSYFDKSPKADHLAHFYYGDILDRDFETTKAPQHYRDALAYIDGLKNPDLETLSVKGQLLFRVGRENDAIQVYDSLLSRPGATAQMRADYGNLLMDAGRYKQADSVLFGKGGK